jgi:hypothetical protein
MAGEGLQIPESPQLMELRGRFIRGDIELGEFEATLILDHNKYRRSPASSPELRQKRLRRLYFGSRLNLAEYMLGRRQPREVLEILKQKRKMQEE